MKIAPVSAPAQASDPKHPDHDRWVKDRTLKMEVDHAKAVGLPIRVAEAENTRLLERSERIERDKKPATKKDKPAAATPNMGRKARVAERGVTVKAAKPELSILKLSPCGRCGLCRNCQREKRVMLIVSKRKEDRFYKALADSLFLFTLNCSGGLGRFADMRKRDRDRAITAKAEEVCDASVLRLGEWKR